MRALVVPSSTTGQPKQIFSGIHMFDEDAGFDSRLIVINASRAFEISSLRICYS